MNRLLFCIILLAFGQSVLAEKLYRWVEPDGSITFSPKPPPAGVDYRAVNAANNNAGTENLTTEDKKRSILATSEHDIEQKQTKTNTTEVLARPAPAIPRQKLSYAPETGVKEQSPTITADAQTQASSTNELQSKSVASSQKSRHCEDLNKRVMSLERRLRSTLTPEDMDNTVIAMARYQRSYDQHCIE